MIVQGIDRLFLRIAVLYVILGMTLGIWMSATENFLFRGVHAHMNLVGWASMALYGLIYQAYPAMAASKLAVWHFWIANVGALLLVLGIAFILLQMHALVPVVIAGSYLSLIPAVLFAINIYSNAGAPSAKERSNRGVPL